MMCIPEEKSQDLTSAFDQYDENSDGWLSVSEFEKFLKDNGMNVEASDVEEAVAMVAPEGCSGIDLPSFTLLVAHGFQVKALREEQYCGYSKEQADVLQEVFDAYDVNHTGVLEAAELGSLLQDIGQAPKTFSEQEKLRATLEKIIGGSLKPLRFREFLELAKILETASIGSGGKDPQEKNSEQRRSSDRMEIARKAGLTMADVAQLQDLFTTEAKNSSTLSVAEIYELLKSRLRLKTAEGEREQQVRATIEKQAGSSGSLDFEDFLVIAGEIVGANLATVTSLLGRGTSHFLGHMAALLQ